MSAKVHPAVFAMNQPIFLLSDDAIMKLNNNEQHKEVWRILFSVY